MYVGMLDGVRIPFAQHKLFTSLKYISTGSQDRIPVALETDVLLLCSLKWLFRRRLVNIFWFSTVTRGGAIVVICSYSICDSPIFRAKTRKYTVKFLYRLCVLNSVTLTEAHLVKNILYCQVILCFRLTQMI